MQNSILTSTKKTLGLEEAYTPFDLDIITFINSGLSSLNQLGIGPSGGLYIVDKTTQWSELGLPADQEAMVKPYIYLKTRLLFDPPGTSYLIEAMQEQLREHEWRLSTYREGTMPPFIATMTRD